MILIPLSQLTLRSDTSGWVLTSVAGHPGERLTCYNFFSYSPVLKMVGVVLSTLQLQEELNITLFSLFDFEDLPLLAVDQLNLNCSSVSAEVFIDGKGTVGNTSGVYTHSFCSGQSLIAEPGTHLSGMWDRAAGIGV